MQRMRALDAGFFYVEDENAPMHVGSVAIFEGPPPAYGDVVRMILGKLPRVPRYRQRVRTVPLHLGRPVWSDDPHFQILYHVRHTAVPAPGGAEQLRNLAGRVFAQRLDRTKPLWEMWLVEGLDGGRWALISKVHHCMVDGIAGTDLMTVVFDRSADVQPVEPRPWTPTREPSGLSVLANALLDDVVEPVQQLAGRPAIARWGRSPQELWTYAQGMPRVLARMAQPGARSLNGRIGPHRRWNWLRASLADIKDVRSALGGTVNDVVLTAITAGFRDLLTARGEVADDLVVRSLVPISVRAPSQRESFNNRVSAVLVNLPVGERDPEHRLAAIREQMDDVKESRQAVGGEVLTSLAGFAAPTLLAVGSRMAMRFPQWLVQTVTTNVPGPRFALYVLGRRLVESFPFVPIAGHVRIGIAIFSYLDQLTFGVTGDFDGVPDLDLLCGGIGRGFDDLHRLAATEAGPARAGAGRKG